MNSTTLSQVIIRVWGVFLVVAALASIGNFLFFLENGGGQWRSSAAAAALHILITFIAGVSFVRYGDQIGKWLASDLPESGPPSSALEILAVAFAVLGAYFLVIGLRSGAVVGIELLTKPKWDGTTPAAYVWERQREAIVVSAVDALAGIILLFGRQNIATGWSRWWHILRSRGENGIDNKAQRDGSD
jgi:hypothetical protein